ncbi:hypothetical protein ACH4SP_11885 [Streptomyces sp. NPDC021093]|uniref:hypothetical protein n=1 Tax=Streptomyces sp. NPDC021093 TaxID=3365112 RepID=UPI00378F2EAB
MARITLGTRFRVAAATTAMTVGTALIPLSSASAAPGTEVGLGGGVTMLASANASYECPRIHTSENWAYTWCRVYSGKVRLIADCVKTPDMPSKWIYRKDGNPTQRLQAGRCPIGVGPDSGVQAAG